ncbi:MAG: phosphopantetheine-binding protein [Nitrospiraceae bacterium]|nr:phosphopantetheine-binding protein [Nitrospiraceae bacterium]
MSTSDRLKKLFVENLELREDALSPEVTLESLGLDSLDKIEFMFAIEDEFKIKVPERDVKINTIQDLIDIIDKFVSEKKQG